MQSGYRLVVQRASLCRYVQLAQEAKARSPAKVRKVFVSSQNETLVGWANTVRQRVACRRLHARARGRK
jgi:hypothetical protein